MKSLPSTIIQFNNFIVCIIKSAFFTMPAIIKHTNVIKLMTFTSTHQPSIIDVQQIVEVAPLALL